MGSGVGLLYTRRVRHLGIDYGERRLGLALSDEGGRLASPCAVWRRESPRRDVRRLTLLCLERGVEAVVVGLPLEQSGRSGETAAAAELFVERLRSHLDLPMELFDERYTSAEAEVYLKMQGYDGRRRRELRDAVAATLILQAYLDAPADQPTDRT